MPERLTLRTAQLAGVGDAALRQAIMTGRLTAEKIDTPRGPYWVVTRTEIERYIAERRPRRTHAQGADS